MREILLLMVLAAMSAGESRGEEGCRATAKHPDELAVCAAPRGTDARPLDTKPTAGALGKTPVGQASLPAEDGSTGSKPGVSAELEALPRARRY